MHGQQNIKSIFLLEKIANLFILSSQLCTRGFYYSIFCRLCTRVV